MKIKLYLLIIPFILFFIFPSLIKAADLTIDCNSSGCSNRGGSLFSESDMAPGFTSAKSILINNYNLDDSCVLNLKITRSDISLSNDISKMINMQIYSGPDIYYSGFMYDAFNKYISIGNIPKNTSREYFWNMHFSESAGNTLQGAGLSFDFSINFVCGYPSTNPNSNHNSNPISNADDGIGRIYAQNTFSDNLIFDDPVLINSPTGGQILGEVCSNTLFSWWIPLVVQGFLSTIGLIIKVISKKFRLVWLLFILLAILSQIVHLIYGCGCNDTSGLCEYYLLFNLGELFLLNLLYIFLSKSIDHNKTFVTDKN